MRIFSRRIILNVEKKEGVTIEAKMVQKYVTSNFVHQKVYCYNTQKPYPIIILSAVRP
jgi:hypothetical protein